MTDEKARDFFSAYYEGTLETGLSMSFEQKLKADWSLQEEYDQFVRAMDELGTLKFEEIEIPHDLHDRISARIDRHLYDRKQSAKPAFGAWLRGLAFAGVGALAIAFAVLALNSHSGTPQAGPGLAADKVDYAVSPEGVVISIVPATSKMVLVRNQGKEVSRNDVGPSGLKTVLSNPLATPAVFEIDIDAEAPIYVVVPGKDRSSVNTGSGSLVDLAKAASDFYRTPVLLEGSNASERSTWTFSSTAAVSEVSKAVGPSYTVTLMQNGMLEIKQ